MPILVACSARVGAASGAMTGAVMSANEASTCMISVATRAKTGLGIRLKQVPSIDFVGAVPQLGGQAVGDDETALRFKGRQVVDDRGVIEMTGLEHRLINNDVKAFGLEAFHDALYGRVTKVVTALFHDQAVNADGVGKGFLRDAAGIAIEGGVVALVAGGLGGPYLQGLDNVIGDEILAGAVGIDDGTDEVIGHVAVVGQQLFGVLGQTIPAIAKGGVVVMRADAGIEADALDDLAGIELVAKGVGVQLIEKSHPHGQKGIGKQFDGLGLGGIGVEDVGLRA